VIITVAIIFFLPLGLTVLYLYVSGAFSKTALN
jgi:hypothetical protein